jgi:hypothetical protein
MIKFGFEDRIDDYCRSDRQWPRALRVAHAEYQKTIAKTDEQRRFWNAVIKRNKD